MGDLLIRVVADIREQLGKTGIAGSREIRHLGWLAEKVRESRLCQLPISSSTEIQSFYRLLLSLRVIGFLVYRRRSHSIAVCEEFVLISIHFLAYFKYVAKYIWSLTAPWTN